MKALRNFALAVVAGAGAWLLWRVNGVIGEQALLMTFGALMALAILACLAVIVGMLWLTLRPEAPQARPEALQAPQWGPPVIVMLGDGSRYGDAPYQAPQGLFAPVAKQAAAKPVRFTVVGEREEWVTDDKWGGA